MSQPWMDHCKVLQSLSSFGWVLQSVVGRVILNLKNDNKAFLKKLRF